MGSNRKFYYGFGEDELKKATNCMECVIADTEHIGHSSRLHQALDNMIIAPSSDMVGIAINHYIHRWTSKKK